MEKQPEKGAPPEFIPGVSMEHTGGSATWPSKQSEARPPPGMMGSPQKQDEEESVKIDKSTDNKSTDNGPRDRPPPGLVGAAALASSWKPEEHDFDNLQNFASWKTGSWNSFHNPDDVSVGLAPPGAFFPGMGGMGMMPPVSGFEMMPGMPMMPPLAGAADAGKSREDLELALQAATLDVRAAQLKHAALQAEMEAELARKKMSGKAVEGTMFGETYTSFGGYGVMPATETKSKKSSKDKEKKEKKEKSDKSSSSTTNPGEQTTLMLRNIPNGYLRDMIVELLDAEGFANVYDFIYLPMDLHRMAGLGYAFVNFVSNEAALRAKGHFEGFNRWKVNSQKVCEVTWGDPLQGLDAHVERYRNSPVMHEDVPDKYKPAQYKNGVRIDLPAPTKRIRPPRIKKSGKADAADDAAGGDDAVEDGDAADVA